MAHRVFITRPSTGGTTHVNRRVAGVGAVGSLSAAGLALALGLTGGCDPEPVPEQAAVPGSECDPADLVNARLVLTTKLTRDTSKPQDVVLPFSRASDEGLCVIVATGTDAEAPSPSLTIDLDEQPLVGPSPFNAHAQVVTRRRAAAQLETTDHELTVNLRGTPGSVAHISVFATREGEGGDFAALDDTIISADRLETPGSYSTVLVDEAVLVADQILEDQTLIAELASLPFSAFLIGSLHPTPIYQVYLPGTEGGQELDDKIAALSALEHIKAMPNRVTLSAPSTLPEPNKDRDSVSDGAFTPAAWYLERINAEAAWGEPLVNSGNYVTSSVKVGIIEATQTGFNLNLPGLSANIAGTIGPPSATFVPEDFSCDGPEDLCEEYADCFGNPAPDASRDHGTAIVGIIGAEGQTELPEQYADTLGLAWRGWLKGADNFGGFLELALLDYTVFEAVTVPPVTVVRETQYGRARVVKEMIASGVRVINMSYGKTKMCQDGSLPPYYGSLLEPRYGGNPVAKLEDELTADWEMWTPLLEQNPGLLVVQSAGNDANKGGPCAENNNSIWCSARANGHACAIPSNDPLSKQVICIAASDQGDAVIDLSNWGGDPLAAPGAFSYMTYEGGLAYGEGTSLAAPVASGAAALLFTVNNRMTARHAHNILVNSGPSIGSYRETSYRRLNLGASMQEATRCLTGVYSEPPSPAVCPEFSDVPPSHWAYIPVNTLACECVLEGYPGEWLFKPEQTINRVEALKIVLKLAFPEEAMPEPQPGDSLYLDTPTDQWYSRYVWFAKKNNLFPELIQEGNFLPGLSMLRSEFMYMVLEAAKASNQPNYQKLASAYAAFKDDQIDALPEDYIDMPLDGDCPDLGDELCFAYHAFHDHIYAATAQCVVEGHPDGYFRPNEDINRAEASKIACIATYGHGSEKCGSFSPCSPYLP